MITLLGDMNITYRDILYPDTCICYRAYIYLKHHESLKIPQRRTMFLRTTYCNKEFNAWTFSCSFRIVFCNFRIVFCNFNESSMLLLNTLILFQKYVSIATHILLKLFNTRKLTLKTNIIFCQLFVKPQICLW